MDLEKFANKRYGQNFLKSDYYKQKIIQSMPKTDNIAVEIGPGLGDLTKRLIHIKDVIAFEIDNDLCNILKIEFKDEIDKNRLILKCGDVLGYWKNSLVDKPYDLVANLPYYAATNIVLRALKDKNCKNILVMLQKEVAQKFASCSEDKEFSSLAVLAQSTGIVKKLFDVSPKSFEPAPKVIKKIEAGRGRRKQWLDASTAFLTLKQLQKGKSFKEICQDLDLDIHWKTLESAIIERRYDKSEVELYLKGVKTISLSEQRRINALIAELEKLTRKKVVLIER